MKKLTQSKVYAHNKYDGSLSLLSLDTKCSISNLI